MNEAKKQPINRSLLSDKVAVRLLDMILQGDLHPGDKLPTESEMGAMFNVGRTAIREALSALNMLNVVNIIQGSGVYVSELQPDMLVRPFQVLASLGNMGLSELFEVREVLEVGIAGIAAKTITDKEIRQLKDALKKGHQVIDDPLKFSKADEALHSIIIRSCKNLMLINIMLSVGELSDLSRQITTFFPAVREHTMVDHEAIVQAIASRDEKASREAMLNHLHNVKLFSNNILEKSSSKPGEDYSHGK